MRAPNVALIAPLAWIAFAALPACKSRGASQIAAGKDNTCLRTEDGRVYCWGDDAYTQTKNTSFAAKPGTRTQPKRVQALEGARDLALSASHGCTAQNGGGVRCFLDVDLEATSISGIDARVVHTYNEGLCALTQQAELKCFRGALREMPRTPVDPPAALASLGPIADLATGERHICVVHTDGTASCFGDDRAGQLGARPPTAPGEPGASAPAKVTGVTDAVAITAGQAHTCVLKKNGHVACWGINDLGQLGHPPARAGESMDRAPTDVAGIEGATSVTAGYYHTCAIVAGGAVMCWGSNHQGELGRPATRSLTAKAERVADLDGAQQVACGEWHTCALLKGGKVKCWGKNHRGQLGDGTNTDSYKPVDVKLP